MSDVVLKVQDLSKTYHSRGGQIAALRGLSFEVRSGTVLAIIGPSGSGKTTLLNLVAGLDHPTGGTVHIADQRLIDLRPDAAADFRRRHIGFVFQFFNLIPTMSVRDNVAIPLLAERWPRRRVDDRVKTVLSAVGLAAHMQRPAAELSGGEMQRVAIARAAVMEPQLLLADEPTGNLDSVTGEAVLELICQVARHEGRALVLVTHSYQAAAYADSILVMRDGQFVEELSADDLRPPSLHVLGHGRNE